MSLARFFQSYRKPEGNNWEKIMKGGIFPVVLFITNLATLLSVSNGQLMTKEHRTHAASERANDLWCYQCDTMDDGEKCVDLAGNQSSLVQKCKDDKRICMVKRYSFTTSTENSTSVPMMWSLERNCTNKCEAGCIVIGERTKVYACTACCERSFCNTGKGRAADLTTSCSGFFLALMLQFLLTVIMYPT